MTPTPDPLPSGLTPAQALGVALSCGPMTNEAMDKAQAAAVPMLAHLEAMGYALAQPAPALDFITWELAARFWIHYRCGMVGCEIVEQHEHGGGQPMREMTPDELAARES